MNPSTTNEINELYQEYKVLVEKNNYILLEGLITTHSIASTISHLKRWFKLPMRISKIYTENDRIFLNIAEKTSIENYERLFKYMNNMGYFCSLYYRNDTDEPNEIKYEQEQFIKHLKEFLIFPLTMIFEAKYDIAVDLNDVHILYHATERKNLEKIKRIGIVPKTKSKISSHPDRIYFTYTLEDCWQMVENFKHLYLGEDYVVLKIDLSKITNRNIKFYNDPNYSNLGIYTYWNIPPNAIVGTIEK
jgi:hypothetical protein